MKTYTATQTDRHGNALDGAPSRKYRVGLPAVAAKFHVMAIAGKGYVHGGSKDGVYTFNPTALGSVVFVRVVEDEPEMTVEQARKVIREMKRDNFDSALADRACAVLSDFDPVFSEVTSETSADPVTEGDTMSTEIASPTTAPAVGAVVEFREDSPQYAKNQGVRYVVVEAPLGGSESRDAEGRTYVWLVTEDTIGNSPSRQRRRTGYVTALRTVTPAPRDDRRDAITAAEARCKVLLSAQNTFALGDTVRCTLPEFAGSEWSEPMTVEQIVANHPLAKPVYARTASGVLGAFSPADLEMVR